MLVAIIGAPAAAAFLGPLYDHAWPGETYWLAVLRWYAGDVLGIALFTPLLLALFSPEMWLLFRPVHLLKTLALMTLMIGASWFVFHQSGLSIAFMVMPVILVVATELGLSGAALAIGLLAIIATAATLRGLGPFGGLYRETVGVRVLVLQFFLIQALSMTLPLSVARVKRLATEGQLKRAWQKMEELASLDGLTGVANRRRFDTVISLEWARARRERLPLALLMIDTDHFKAFNDHYGHPAGDACLRSVARAIADIPARPGDLVARYGGEEFVVLLPGSDVAGACMIAEMVRRTVYALGVPHDVNAEQRVTVSIGLAAMVPENQIEPTELIAASDRALYRAKHEGRNRVQIALDLAVASAIVEQADLIRT
jgi:diguanylate cyclase (GGDEF)-like protein